MTIWEYMKAVDELQNWQSLPQEDKLLEKNLRRYVIAVITIKAHAWCMDVETERRKMSQVVLGILDEVSRYGY
jgi:hypothetical protein